MAIQRLNSDRQTYGENTAGRLYRADAADLPQAFLDEYQDSVSVVYMDPPFFTGQSFSVRMPQGRGSFSLYEDRWESLDEYLGMMRNAIVSAKHCLKPDGLIYVHVDYRVAAYIRLILDEVFGRENFLNEIIWHYKSGGTSKNHFARKHDNILLYSKSSQYYFNIGAVGMRRGRERRNHMKYNVDEQGRVYYSIKSMGKIYKYYEEQMVYPTDVWTDIPHLHQKDPERLGYDTQKPERLLERMILPASKEGDLVADFFMGSGTSASVAVKHNRQFLGLDKSPYSVEITKARLLENGASVAVHMDPIQSGGESLRVSLSRQADTYFVQVLGYGADEDCIEPEERQLGLFDLPAGDQVASAGAQTLSGTESVQFLSVGYQEDGEYKAYAHSARRGNHLNTAFEIPVKEGELVVEVCDVYSNFGLFSVKLD